MSCGEAPPTSGDQGPWYTAPQTRWGVAEALSSCYHDPAGALCLAGTPEGTSPLGFLPMCRPK